MSGKEILATDKNMRHEHEDALGKVDLGFRVTPEMADFCLHRMRFFLSQIRKLDCPSS